MRFAPQRRYKFEDTRYKAKREQSLEAFENLEVWKRSSSLCIELYKELRDCRDFGFKDQITRAALSVPSNIAEGYERDSRNEYIRFLRIAKGSCGELRTQLYIGAEIGFIKESRARKFISEAAEIARMIHGLTKKLQASNEQKA